MLRPAGTLIPGQERAQPSVMRSRQLLKELLNTSVCLELGWLPRDKPWRSVHGPNLRCPSRGEEAQEATGSV